MAQAVVNLQVIGPVLTDFYHCLHCEQIFEQAGISARIHREQVAGYPPDFEREAQELADWVIDLLNRYGDRIRIQLIDPQSLQGFLISLRYWVRRYPAFIIDGRKTVIGSDPAALNRAIESSLSDRPAVPI